MECIACGTETHSSARYCEYCSGIQKREFQKISRERSYNDGFRDGKYGLVPRDKRNEYYMDGWEDGNLVRISLKQNYETDSGDV